IIQTRRTYSAFVIQGDSMAIKHKLALGIEQGNKVEVLDGLQAGDKIVVTGQNNLADSSMVLVVNSQTLHQEEAIPIGNGDVTKRGSSDTKDPAPANQ